MILDQAIEEDSGLWIVRRDGQKIGAIWCPNQEEVIMDGAKPECFVALDEWVDGVTPGNEYGRFATWEEALSAISDEADEQARLEAERGE